MVTTYTKVLMARNPSRDTMCGDRPSARPVLLGPAFCLILSPALARDHPILPACFAIPGPPRSLSEARSRSPRHERRKRRERAAGGSPAAGLLTHLSEEPVVDKVDHKDLRDEEKALLLSPGLPGCRDGLLAFFFLAPREAAGVGVAWAFRGFLILPL